MSLGVAYCQALLRDLEQDTKIAGLQCFIFKMSCFLWQRALLALVMKIMKHDSSRYYAEIAYTGMGPSKNYNYRLGVEGAFVVEQGNFENLNMTVHWGTWASVV